MHKVVVVVFVALAVAYVTKGESCTVGTDCVITSCGVGAVLCKHPDHGNVIAGEGTCTCRDIVTGCVEADECYGDKAPELGCHDSQRHCYDSNCVCDGYPSGFK